MQSQSISSGFAVNCKESPQAVVHQSNCVCDSTHNRSFRRWVFPGNQLHWNWQPNNKSAQSNLGRWLPLGAVAHICRNVPISYNGMPQSHPKTTPDRGPIPKPHYLPHLWTCLTYDAKQHPDTIRRFSTMHWTDRPTDCSWESLMTIRRCATRVTRPNKETICKTQKLTLKQMNRP